MSLIDFAKNSLNAFGSAVSSGLGSGLTSGLLNSIFNSDQRQLRNAQKLTAIQTAANKELYDYQFQKESEYNDPSAQRSRLEKAGFNPALMYGAGDSGSVSAQIGNSGLEHMGAPYAFGNPDPESVSRVEANIALADKYKAEAASLRGETIPALDTQALKTSQTNFYEASMRKLNEETKTEEQRRENIRLDNLMKDRLNRLEEKTEDLRLQSIKDQYTKIGLDLEKMRYDLSEKEFWNKMQPYRKARFIAEYNNLLRDYVIKGVQAKLMEAGLQKTYAEVTLAISKSKEADAKVQELISRVGLTEAKTQSENELRDWKKAHMAVSMVTSVVDSVANSVSAVKGFGGSSRSSSTTLPPINGGASVVDSPIFWE